MDQILASLAKFSSELAYRDLPDHVVAKTKDLLLDSLGCAIGAHGCDTAEMGRSLAGPPASKELAGHIVGSKKPTAADAAAFVNACMIRYLELNDTLLPGGHPSDMLGALFAIAPQIGASGERLIAATVVAYEIFIRMEISAHLREKGWDQGFGISVGAAAGLASLMGLDPDVAQHAIAITAVANTPMRATRAGQLSLWKGAATAYAVRNAVFGVQLARAGMTGPEAPFTGRHGLVDLISGPIEMPPFGNTADDFFMPRINIKYWPVAYSLQPLVWAGIELSKQVRPEQLASVEVHTSWHSWHESGSEPAKWDPTTKATADHSVPYILAWTLRHGGIDQSAYVPESYLDPSIRPLMQLITARVDDEIEKEYQREVRMRVTATDRSGKSYEVNIINPIGHAKNPVSAKDLAAKFARLCESRLSKRRIGAALKLWQNLETVQNTKDAFDAAVFKGGPSSFA
jgi:2-methylcitrate dehydratase